MTSTERWLGNAARAVIARERPFIVAITGAVGKSTTKQAVAAVLRASDRPRNEIRVSAKNYNNELGVPLTVFDAEAPGRSIPSWLRLIVKACLAKFGLRRVCPKTLVLEMGADKPGDIAYLTSIATPDIAIVTAVTPEGSDIAPVHTGNYASIDAVVAEKGSLVKAVRTGGTVIVNADDKRTFAMRHSTAEHVLTFGEADGADVRIKQTSIRLEVTEHGKVPVGLDIELETYQRAFRFFVPGVFGRPIAYALAAGAAVGLALDVSDEQIQDAVSALEILPGRTRILPGIKHTTILDDSYNASPAAVLSAVRDLMSMPLAPGQRRAAAIGEMRELGPDAATLHRMVGSEAAKAGIDLLVCCGIFAGAMAEGARANGMTPEAVQVVHDAPEAGLFLQKWIKPGDVVLVKGSEGPLPSSPNFRTTTGVRMERVAKELMAEPLRASELLPRQLERWLE